MNQLTATIPAPPVSTAATSRLSSTGLLVVVTSLLLAGSAFVSFRVEVGGFLVHPCLMTMPLLFLATASRFHLVNRTVLFGVSLFMTLFIMTSVPSSGMIGEDTKPLVWFALMFLTALAIRTERDFELAVVALALSALVFAVKAVTMKYTVPGMTGLNPFKGIGNKNVYSLYSLPPFLLAGYLALDKKVSLTIRALLVVSMLGTLAATFESANRSGWLGMVLVGVMLLAYGRRVKTVVLVAVLAGGTYYIVDHYLGADVFESRLEQTEEGYHSDTVRKDLFTTAVQIGLEHPILGVSPQKLPYHLAERLEIEEADNIDPHNVLGLVIGGCGLITTAAFFFWLWTMWRRPRGTRARTVPKARSVHALLRMCVALFFVRGMFSREVLYVPSFALLFGIVLGYCRIHRVWRRA